MRSLWKTIAVRWLGGQASDALTADATLLELLMPAESEPPAFLVRRLSEVSHRAMMSQQDQTVEHEAVLAHVSEAIVIHDRGAELTPRNSRGIVASEPGRAEPAQDCNIR